MTLLSQIFSDLTLIRKISIPITQGWTNSLGRSYWLLGRADLAILPRGRQGLGKGSSLLRVNDNGGSTVSVFGGRPSAV